MKGRYLSWCVHGAGARETVRFLPPLSVSEAEIDSALRILSEALEEVFGKPFALSAGA